MRCSWCRSRWGGRKARSISCSGSWDSTPRSASIPRSWPACGTSYGSAPDWRSCGSPGAAPLPSAPEMTIVTHILATTLGVQAMQLHGREAALAYAFGVGLRDRGGYFWRSSLQEPVALLWIIPLALLLPSIVPVLFFAIHAAMDYSVRFEKMPLYPYSRWVTRGWLTGIPDKVKEGVLVAALVVLNALIWWSRRHV